MCIIFLLYILYSQYKNTFINFQVVFGEQQPDLSRFSAPHDGCWPSITIALAWGVLPGSRAQKLNQAVKLPHGHF